MLDIDNINIIDNYYDRINNLIISSKKRVFRNINYEMVQLYFEIGHIIYDLIEIYHLEASQNEIIKSFSKRLTESFGKGFGSANLKLMKKFYFTY